MNRAGLLGRHIPKKIKPSMLTIYRRLLRLKNNPIKQFNIKLCQRKLLIENYSPSIKNLIIFLTPGRDIVNGGIISISSIFGETVKLKRIHEAQVILCSVPGDPLLLRYTKFKNQNFIYGFPQVLFYFQNLQNLLIHIPEYCADRFLRDISNRACSKLLKIKNVHINIMLQNIESLPDIKDIKLLKKFGKMTCTTAHERYSNVEIRKKLGFPLHKLSTFVSPEQYNKKAYVEKENLMIVSPDKHPRKSEILASVAMRFPNLKIQIIENLTYEEYKNVISKAKWSLTFGEGLDGYFVETIFSGGISFSNYNSNFFTNDFKSLLTVYDDYDQMIKKICLDISYLDNEKNYSDYQCRQYALCNKYYKYGKYTKNIELFYKGDHTYK